MSTIPFGTGATVFVLFYLLVMLVFGFLARRARRSESLSDFYLAGKGLGVFVLLLTLYATQYSGNTLLGYPGEAYRLGFAWIMSVGFMMSIIVVYLLFAPKLQQVAKLLHFITPGDWIDYRFGSSALTIVANILLVVAMANYLLAQLMAMGHVVAGLSGSAVHYSMGVIFLAIIIIVYETLGGMRAVAWTDCIQGMMLLIGLLGLVVVAVPGPDQLHTITEWIVEHQPQKAVVPPWEVCRYWLSTVLLVGFSGAVYPQAIQRIYAARDARVLKKSLSIMVFMPLLTIMVVFLIGILGISHFSNLQGISADQVMPLLLREWAGQSLWQYSMAVLVVTGVLAAIMSTADSVLLSLSSILAKDFLGKSLYRGVNEDRLTRVGKIMSWIVMAAVVIIAISPRVTLWGLTELKMEILSQVSPVFVLGISWPRLTARAAIAGMLAGSVVSISLTLLGHSRVWGLHAGLLGLGLNFLCCMTITLLLTSKKE